MNITRNIELVPHVGHKEDGTRVVFAQDQIMLNGVRAGYVGHQPNAPINIIRPGVATDVETLEAIKAAVRAKFGGESSKVAAVPTLTDEEFLDLAEGRTAPPPVAEAATDDAED